MSYLGGEQNWKSLCRSRTSRNWNIYLAARQEVPQEWCKSFRMGDESERIDAEVAKERRGRKGNHVTNHEGYKGTRRKTCRRDAGATVEGASGG